MDEKKKIEKRIDNIKEYCKSKFGEIDSHNDFTYAYSLGYKKACCHILAIIEREDKYGRK